MQKRILNVWDLLDLSIIDLHADRVLRYPLETIALYAGAQRQRRAVQVFQNSRIQSKIFLQEAYGELLVQGCTHPCCLSWRVHLLCGVFQQNEQVVLLEVPPCRILSHLQGERLVRFVEKPHKEDAP